MVPSQEANGDNLGIFFFIFYTIIAPRWGDFNEYTQHTISP